MIKYTIIANEIKILVNHLALVWSIMFILSLYL